MSDYITWQRCSSPAIRQMDNLLRERFLAACKKLEMAYFVSDHVWEARAAARTALNTWYTFMVKYHRLRTDKQFYWERYAEQ